MAGNFNRVLLMGNLTRDVELKYTPTNMAVAEIGLAVNHRYRTKDGEDRDEPMFVDCEAWGKTAETMSKYLAKGRPVFIEGRLKLDQWQDKEGNKRSKHRVVVENFQFIDSRTDGAGGRGTAASGGAAGGGGGGSEPAPARQPAGAAAKHEPISDEDIPF